MVHGLQEHVTAYDCHQVEHTALELEQHWMSRFRSDGGCQVGSRCSHKHMTLTHSGPADLLAASDTDFVVRGRYKWACQAASVTAEAVSKHADTAMASQKLAQHACPTQDVSTRTAVSVQL